MMKISRSDLYSPVVKVLKNNGGSASLNEINSKVRMDMLPVNGDLTENDLFTLHVLSVIEDLERNGMVERIEDDLFTLSY